MSAIHTAICIYCGGLLLYILQQCNVLYAEKCSTTSYVKPTSCSSGNQPLTQEAQERLLTQLSSFPLSRMDEDMGKPGFKETENSPLGLYFIFKAIINQSGSLELPVQSIATGRIPDPDPLMTILKQ